MSKFVQKTNSMALRTFVKVGAITNLSDARYCSGMYVDVLGFVLEESATNFVTSTQFQEITGWISGCALCAEFATADEETVVKSLQNYPEISWIQHSDLDVLVCLEKNNLQKIWEIPLDQAVLLEDSVLDQLGRQNIHLLISGGKSDLSEAEKISLTSISSKINVLLGTGIVPDQVNSLTQELGLFGLALEGGEEIKPGLKDFDELAAILEELEWEDFT